MAARSKRSVKIMHPVVFGCEMRNKQLLVPVTVHREQSMKREDQQDATVRSDVWLTVHRNSVWIRKTN